MVWSNLGIIHAVHVGFHKDRLLSNWGYCFYFFFSATPSTQKPVLHHQYCANAPPGCVLSHSHHVSDVWPQKKGRLRDVVAWHGPRDVVAFTIFRS